MSKSGLTQAPSEQWDSHAWGDRQLIRLSWLKVEGLRKDCLFLLPNAWRFFWRSRGSRAYESGYGCLHACQAAEEVFLRDGLVAFWTFPFQSARQVAPHWQNWQKNQGYLPRLRLSFDGESSCLSLCQFLDKSESEAQQRMAMRQELEQVYQDLLARQQQELPSPWPRLSLGQSSSQADWQQLIHRAKHSIQLGTLRKVVLSRQAEYCLSHKIEPASCLRRLDTADESSYVFMVQEAGDWLYFGRSPERLLAWQGNSLEGDAIAGTRARHRAREEDSAQAEALWQSEKDLEEHRYVMDLISQDLQHLGLSFQQGQRELLSLSHVHHMRTRYQGTKPAQLSALKVLEALHPTPAVGGFPRAEALAFVQEWEGWDRGLFTGGIGLVSADRGELAISLRSALAEGHCLRVFAGAGIVAESQADEEWLETEAKMQRMLSLFTPASAQRT